MAQLPRRIDVPAFLQQKLSQGGPDAEWWVELEKLYGKKLWHQLTIKLLSFVSRPEARDLREVYHSFIADFEMKLNPFYLVEIVAHIVKGSPDVDETIAFLTNLKTKVKANQDASILTSILICRLKLQRRDLEGVKAILEEVSPLVDAETGVTPIHGRYFQLSSDFHQLVGNHNEYYRDALRYLGCIKLSDLDPQEHKKMAFALSLAALLGDSVYNFGELLQHPISGSVQQDFPWLHDLLVAFNSGDLKRFEQLRPQWTTQPDLQRQEMQLRKKISLLSLMQLTFQSTSGVLTFAEIANVAALPIEEVELLVMKALSLGLVKGTIDEVDQKVHLTWVQPRVLDRTQIAHLKSKIDSWCREVRKIEHLLQDKAQDFAC